MATQEKEYVIETIVEASEAESVTTVTIEHDMDLVKEYADRLVAHDGQVFREGDPDLLETDPDLRRVLLGWTNDVRSLLEVSNLSALVEGFEVTHGIDLEVREGEAVALVGRNGAGKTSTFRSIMGLTPVANGSVRFKGEELIDRRAELIPKRGIGYQPENRDLFTG